MACTPQPRCPFAASAWVLRNFLFITIVWLSTFQSGTPCVPLMRRSFGACAFASSCATPLTCCFHAACRSHAASTPLTCAAHASLARALVAHMPLACGSRTTRVPLPLTCRPRTACWTHRHERDWNNDPVFVPPAPGRCGKGGWSSTTTLPVSPRWPWGLLLRTSLLPRKAARKSSARLSEQRSVHSTRRRDF